jgi:hypothetical protein
VALMIILPVAVYLAISSHFLAYSLCKEKKHGYLGKYFWVPIPYSEVGGIHKKFPDSNHSYVGFKATKFN